MDPIRLESYFTLLHQVADEERELELEQALLLFDESVPLDALIAIAERPRRRHFQNRALLHVLNNVKNGDCTENCSYCAQRAGGPEAGSGNIEIYDIKSDEEILEEARVAYDSGAFRYCLAVSGRGPSRPLLERLSRVIRKIKDTYNIEVCLSAGILKKPELASLLVEAGLDRYNHNLNASADFYGEICTSHEYADRTATLQTLSDAGLSLCSGVIVGMGEGTDDLARTAFELRRLKVKSLPVNFFIPVPGHAVASAQKLSRDYCLRALCLFRLANPRAEIRLAAGRELYLGASQGIALRVADSLFVSGYLNVKGSNLGETLRLLHENGFEPDARNSNFSFTPQASAASSVAAAGAAGVDAAGKNPSSAGVEIKSLDELRPFR